MTRILAQIKHNSHNIRNTHNTHNNRINVNHLTPALNIIYQNNKALHNRANHNNPHNSSNNTRQHNTHNNNNNHTNNLYNNGLTSKDSIGTMEEGHPIPLGYMGSTEVVRLEVVGVEGQVVVARVRWGLRS